MAIVDIQDPHVKVVISFTHEEWKQFFDTGSWSGRVDQGEDRDGRKKVIQVDLATRELPPRPPG